MTSPLAMLAVATPAPSGQPSGVSAPDSRGSRDGNDASSFSKIMARQRAGQDAAAPPPADSGHPAAADAAAGPQNATAPVKNDATGDAAQKDDDKTSAEAPADAAAPTLAQQALAIAAMALQLQNGQANTAQVAPNGQGSGQVATAAAGVAAASNTPGSAPATAAEQALLADTTVPPDGPASAPTATATAGQAGLPTLPATAAATAAPAAGQTMDSAAPKASRAAGTAHEPLANGQARRANDRAVDAASTAATDARGGDSRTNAQGDASRIQAAGKTTVGDKEAAVDAAAAPRNAAHAPQADMTQALANAWQAPAAPANPGTVPAPAIQTPVGQAQWGAELGGQLVLMTHRAGGDSHTAELRLDPPDLGPLRVTIKLNDGVAEASFVSAHAAVRQAVESALPQLQQTLAQAGISLGQANVSDHGAQAGFGGMHQGSDRPGQGTGQTAQSQPDTASDTVQILVPPARRGNAGLVDTFA